MEKRINRHTAIKHEQLNILLPLLIHLMPTAIFHQQNKMEMVRKPD